MSPTTKATVEAYHHGPCTRCGYDWWSWNAVAKSCARCKSKQWDKPRERAPKRDARALRNARYRATLKRKAREARRAKGTVGGSTAPAPDPNPLGLETSERTDPKRT